MVNMEFVELVEKMRKAQKAYFATRKWSLCLYSKDLEKKVDGYIEAILNERLKDTQTKLDF